jgi:uncharacterized protein with PIN domain
VRVAYVDTSCLVAVAFDESHGPAVARRLAGYDELVSANLLEAEFRAALRREAVDDPGSILDGLAWVLPDRPLTAEIERALRVTYLRGADLWHVATALYVADDPAGVDFLTLDREQASAAGSLGFGTPILPC